MDRWYVPGLASNQLFVLLATTREPHPGYSWAVINAALSINGFDILLNLEDIDFSKIICYQYCKENYRFPSSAAILRDTEVFGNPPLSATDIPDKDEFRSKKQ